MGRGEHHIYERKFTRNAQAHPTQLAVVASSLALGQRELAMGNIVGACIANILGSFSLGILFPGLAPPDKSSRIYTALLLVLSIGVALLSQIDGGKGMGRPAGVVLLVGFLLYVGGVGWAIWVGAMRAPEGSDSESEDSDSDSASGFDYEGAEAEAPGALSLFSSPPARVVLTCVEPAPTTPTDTTPLLPPPQPNPSSPRTRHSTTSHVLKIFLSMLALTLSGALLSTSCSALAVLLSIPPTTMGLTVLSLSTTLPEKVVSLYAGARGQTGILVANSVGSNLFLLTLVLGTALVWAPQQEGGAGAIGKGDAVWLVAAPTVLTTVVWCGWLKRSAGVGMLVGYVAYLVSVFSRR